ncbi:TonB-dependent receptor [Chryseolinea lacunae]|uniref:TonB-dependent receptor n=1 Tax=Chryseolinea lacunae TaxID=2801331 RepID=A0ABS1KPA3_9BACT|nr:TonB-dependent receptor [Chryseolinea lacunae]MBL0741184.1 TonB-dependent receptor [Chryseolinea lacunae]
MTRFSLLWLPLMICATAWGQNAALTGKVTGPNQEALPGVSIHVLNTNAGASTDANGEFSIADVPHGKYTVQVSAVGYATQNQDVIVGSENAASLTVSLQESSTQLDAVVVTAEKQEQNLQKVPFTVNAISARQVEQYRLWNSKDITAIVPNLYSTNPGDNRNVTSIRGVTSTSYDPAVATYIDGVNQFSLDTYMAQLFDVERIEVLSGPQGTLYGRNAMGGVINIITKKPTNTVSGFGEVNVGNYGQQRYAFGVRTPLVKNKLYFGATAVYDRMNGFYKNDFDQNDFDKKHSLSGNYYLRYNVSNAWSITLNAKHSANRNNGTFPLAGSKDEAFDNPFRVNQNAVTQLVDNIFNSSLVANYAGRGLNFSSQTSYQSNYRYYKDPIDGDFSPLDIVSIKNNYGSQWNNVKVWTQEFKFSSPATASDFKWTAGTYMFHQNNPVKQATRYGEDAALFGIPDELKNSSSIITSTGKSTGIAFYGQATYSFFEKLDFTLGLRYDYEHKKQSVMGEFQMDPNPDPIMVTQSDTTGTVNYHAFSPKASVAYHLTDNNTVYGTYSRGYRAGGLTQLSSDPSQPPLFAYNPEYSNNLEVGFKNLFFENRLQVNVSAFYVRITDAQVPTLILPDAITVTRNAGTLTSQGIDLNVSTTPLKGLQIDCNLGLNDAKYKTLKLAQNGEEVNLNGNHQIFTPSMTSMTAAQYTLGIGAVKVLVRGEWMALGKQYFDLGNTVEQKAYNVLNARVGASYHGFDVMLWGRNLGDTKYIAYAYDFGATHLGDPRNYGVTLRKTF